MWSEDIAAKLRRIQESFDKTPTGRSTGFEALVIVAAVLVLLWLRRYVDKLWQRFFIMASGVLIFELFTAPMWNNQHLGAWGYIYRDVSWILTLGWTTMILAVVVLVDRFLPRWHALARFAVYLVCLLVLVVPAEIAVVTLGIRTYSPEVLQATSGRLMAGVPAEILYYVPVFTTLVITFYKYWAFQIDDLPLAPVKRQKWGRAVLLGFAGVLLFELMIEPMVRNEHFPRWSYIYRDVSIVLSAAWVIIIAAAALIVERRFLHWPAGVRFATALGLMYVLALPLESWLIRNGYRVYGESATRNFVGYVTPITGVPIEVAFAIPCYLALVVAFVRYWEIVLDNEL